MKLGELIPLSGKHFKSKTTVPAGRAAVANLGTVGITFGIDQSTGETSRPSVKMPKYRPLKGHVQGTR